MRTTLLLTAVGPDRTGLVESLAQRIAAAGGNREESSMGRLAGSFAGIVLVSIGSTHSHRLVASVWELEAAGMPVSARTVPAPVARLPGSPVRLAVTGGDRPGIVRDVSRVLAERGVNVEELLSSMASAPMSGEP